MITETKHNAISTLQDRIDFLISAIEHESDNENDDDVVAAFEDEIDDLEYKQGIKK